MVQLSKGYKNDAGVDVIVDKDITFPAKKMTVFPLGVKITPNKNRMAIIAPRSSYAAKGLLICNCPVDADYTGEIHAIVFNAGDEDVVCRADEAFCQILMVKIQTIKIKPRKKGRRRNHSFGSTGA